MLFRSCATHCKLAEAAQQGQFRQDLYYRINGLTVQLPALRERNDFAALTERLLAELSPDREVHLAPDLQVRLAAYHWPGNLRQLSSALRTACALLGDEETVLDWPHLPDDLLDALNAPMEIATPDVLRPQQEPQSLHALSQAAIQQAQIGRAHV